MKNYLSQRSPRIAMRRLRRYHLAFTPKALNSKAQCREAHTGCDWTKIKNPDGVPQKALARQLGIGSGQGIILIMIVIVIEN